ncbi:hypothetical protein JCM10908_005797 [Rhodotorula pacifica]|uniref:uncharacterized protein n=1 Tax=Rhodotorula pacifica TaxID=1495444 RepID=UPI00316ED665
MAPVRPRHTEAESSSGVEGETQVQQGRGTLSPPPRPSGSDALPPGTGSRLPASLGVAGGREPSASQVRRVSRRVSTNPYPSDSRRTGEAPELPGSGPSSSQAPREAAEASASQAPPPSAAAQSTRLHPGDSVGPVALERSRSSSSSTTASRHFELAMLQQPRVGAELGLVRNTLGRLPIVPAPVVEVTVRNDAGEKTDTELPFLFCSALLREQDGVSAVETIQPPAERRPVAEAAATSTNEREAEEEWSALVGQLVRNPRRVEDLEGEQRSVFVFEDVSVRTQGTYRLEFMLGEARRPHSPRLAAIVSDPFEVVAWEDYPGLSRDEIVPPFSMHLHEQGIPIWMPPLHTTRADTHRADPDTPDTTPSNRS